MLITSILKKNEDGEYLDNNTVVVEGGVESVKEMLGLHDNEVIKVDSISKEPFKTTTLEQLNLNTTSNNVTQPVVSNEEKTNELEEFFDAEDDGVTQPSSTTADPAVEQSTPVSSSKAPTNSMLPKVASPSETKNGSNNGAVVLYQMLHDQGRLHPSPELYDYLLRASLEREISFCKVVPNSSLVQTREEQVASNNRSC
ncbi:hypothetical protein [Wolbachia endosymbiont (group A) of Anomoia purmunda]|uniref:hypothetical protein n=1 Tax=Wolbachia endosymbiont (group A) of Anomoia purmunda TaxID=2953978 RepID=UPI0022304BE2|nr:hypothetical protein [Wolbachia endosymbiont (group A) of Anomoia purmunda]